MEKTKRQKPPEFLVVPDSNTVFSEKKPWDMVGRGFSYAWEQLLPLGGLRLILPEVVVRERMYQVTQLAKAALHSAQAAAGTLKGVTGDSSCCILPTFSAVEEQLKKQFEEWCKRNEATVLPTPHAVIDWKRVHDDALSRNPPFSPGDTEKGFRDCLLMETFLHLATSHSEKSVTFICRDKLLVSAARNRLPNNSAIHESLANFGSHFRLAHEQLAKEFVERLLGKVKEVFFTADNIECVYYKFEVLDQLHHKFGQSLNNPTADLGFSALFDLSLVGEPPSLTPWIPVSDEQAFIYEPEFEQLAGKDVFTWKSQIEIVRLFNSDPKPDRSHRTERLLKARFNVLWSAKISDEAEFSDYRIRDITEGEKAFERPSFEQKQEYGFEIHPLERILRDASRMEVGSGEPGEPNLNSYLSYLAPLQVRSKPKG